MQKHHRSQALLSRRVRQVAEAESEVLQGFIAYDSTNPHIILFGTSPVEFLGYLCLKI